MTDQKSIAKKEYYVDTVNAFKMYGDNIYRLALVRTASKSDAEDVLQDVFLRLVKSSHKIKSEEHLKAWLIKVAINRCNSCLSSPHRKRRAELEEASAVTLSKEASVLPAVLTLEEKHRTVIYMHYFEGYEINEISKLLSVPSGTVKSRLSRARENLKAILEGGSLDV